MRQNRRKWKESEKAGKSNLGHSVYTTQIPIENHNLFTVPVWLQAMWEMMLTLSLVPPGDVPSCIPNAIKQRRAPIHSRAENPPNNWRRNFTISGVCLGGVIALGPSLWRISAAFSSVRPYNNETFSLVSPQHISGWIYGYSHLYSDAVA